MSIERALGWQITVERPGGAVPQVYNVAITDDQLAMEVVKRVLQDAKGAVLCQTARNIDPRSASNFDPSIA